FSVIEEYLGVPDMWLVVPLVVCGSWIKVHVLAEQFAEVIACSCRCFHLIQSIIGITVGGGVDNGAVGAGGASIHEDEPRQPGIAAGVWRCRIVAAGRV